MNREEICKQFAEDIKSHEMNIVCNDGVNRRIRFKRPDSRAYFFDLVTWPGHLCVTGDMGTYVFARTEDMFEFFRREDNYASPSFPDVSLHINPGYWAEKLLSIDKCNGAEKFSPGRFRETVKSYFVDTTDDLADCDRAELWEAIEADILSVANDGEYPAYAAVHDFVFNTSDGDDWRFEDFFECSNSEMSYHFLWCLFAIVWGIKRFDAEVQACEFEKVEVTE